MRLCVVFHEARPLGAGLSVTRVLGLLTEYGWSVDAWLPESGALVDVLEQQGISTTVGASPLAFSLRGWRQPPGVARRVARSPAYLASLRQMLVEKRPHVVHANALLSLPEATVAHRLGLPVVLHIHELLDDNLKTRLSLRWAARVADVLVAVSSPVARALQPYAGGSPLLTINNGVAQVSSEPTSGTGRKKERFVVGTVGVISRRKGTDLLVRAAEIVRRSRPGIAFEHIGPLAASGQDLHFGESLLADQKGDASPLVEFLGERAIEDALTRWSAFAFPSRQDPFPLAILEAMAAGLPVVATRVGGIAEQLAGGEAGILIRAEDPDELARAIVGLHDDEQLRKRMAIAAVSRAADFTIEEQAGRLHQAYLLALARHHAPPMIDTHLIEGAHTCVS